MSARACLWLAAALLLAACGSPIVGAECRAGWLECDGVCVEVQSDPENCGACGKNCGPFECSGGMCGPLRRHEDGGLDAGADGGDGGDAGTTHMPGQGKGGVGSPFLPDSGLSGCAIGLTECGGVCVDTLADHNNCGECGMRCGSAQFCVEAVCSDACDAPLQECHGQCVDFQVDEVHCGSCNNVCKSGICTAGACGDVIPGSLIVIGHNFAGATPAMQIIAGNAVLLAPGSPLRVLMYRGSARRAEYDGVVNAINAHGRAWNKVDVKVDDVVTELRDASVLVILPQDTTNDSSLRALGKRWSLALSQFLYRGGVVVLFETATSKNSGTFHVLEPAGLFAAAGRESIPLQTMTVKTPGFDIAVNAPTRYRSAGGTVHFLDVQTDGAVVVEDGMGKPVVIHRVISP